VYILPHATVGINIKAIMLSQRSQSQKLKYCEYLYEIPEMVKENRMVVTRDWRK
jgi:hypothetical protein